MEIKTILRIDRKWGQGLTGCCLNRYFVNENYDEYFLFSKVDLIPAQPMISAIWQGERLHQNATISCAIARQQVK